MTAIQTLACQSQAIACRIPSRDLQMCAIIYVWSQLIPGGMTCAQIIAGAESISQCGLEQNQLLPALIAIAQQIPTIGPTGPQGPQGATGATGATGPTGPALPDYVNYAGPPLVNPPLVQNIVCDSNGRQWQFYNSQWN